MLRDIEGQQFADAVKDKLGQRMAITGESHHQQQQQQQQDTTSNSHAAIEHRNLGGECTQQTV